MRVTPDAAFDDGLLDVLVLNRIPVHEFLRVFPKVFSGRARRATPRSRSVGHARCGCEAAGIVAYADGERFAPLPRRPRGRARRAVRAGLTPDVA